MQRLDRSAGATTEQFLPPKEDIGSGLFIAPYEGESPCAVAVVFDEDGHIGYVDERPTDRDIDGILWERWGGTQTGPIQWSHHRPERQRAVMERPHRCGGCAGEPDHDERGVLWLLNANQQAQATLTFPRDIRTATPAMCLQCAERALRACRVLQAGFIALRVRETELVGVRGTLHSPTSPPQADRFVRFDDGAIHRVVARQLMLELRDAELDEDTLSPPSHGGRAPTAVPGPVWGWQ
ncbi:hypothetical protein [Streptomyces sp. NRRL F-5527]|uniref:hypothetical protein n=1 Tax=Streptomyces sp. NRRL F-5527 TaxID=1463862 RepID=UPI000689AF14|nr:hypothetical protein [Streptomyces sp. NRRL F-5527]